MPLVVIHWPSFGPYHVARLRACRAAAPTGVSVVGLAVAGTVSDRPWDAIANGDDVPVQVAFPGRSYETIKPAEAARAVRRLLDELHPTVVGISGWGMADSRACLAWCRRHRAVRILMSESKADDAARVWWRERIKRWLVRKFDAAVCGGTPHRRYLEQLGLPPARIFEKYDVVDNACFERRVSELRGQRERFEHLPGLAGNRPFFLVCSRLIARKNLESLLAAYGRYRSRRPDGWPLVILGTGHLQQQLERLVQDQAMPQITFAGFRQLDELVAYYAFAGALIHPALQEQWGLVVNEALAVGLPVLVSNTVGCAADLVRDGVNGFTFDPHDTESLYAVMDKLSAPAFPLEAFGRASRRIIAEWRPDDFARSFWQAVGTGRRGRKL
jgi:1,2-diacylglycerol 3-alpha-glucosyltransferase